MRPEPLQAVLAWVKYLPQPSIIKIRPAISQEQLAGSCTLDQVEIEVAALLAGEELNLDMSQFLDKVEKEILGRMKAGA